MDSKIASHTSLIYRQIIEMISDEDCENHIELTDENLTDFFTSLSLACSILFNKLTGEHKSYLEYSHVVNQLIVQYIIEHGSLSSEKESE